jgi:hypothetical protein
LSLPRGGLRQVVIQTKIFEKYAGEHAARWFDWSEVIGLPIKRMEDLVLICGCTLVTSWAAVAFDGDSDAGAQVSLASRTLENGGASFVWSNINGTVEHHDSRLDPVCFSLLVYVLLGAVVLTFFFPFVTAKRVFHTHPRINASSSSSSEQSRTSSGKNSSRAGRHHCPLISPEQRSFLLRTEPGQRQAIRVPT